MNDKSKSFNEQTYYSEYKKIRNKFRKYDPLHIITECIIYINKPSKDKIDQLQKQPWLVLLLIKWIIIDDEFHIPGRKKIDKSKLQELLHLMYHLGDSARHPQQYDNTRLFLRNISYQQFIFQQEYSLGHLARQLLLFSHLPENSLIKLKFKDITGIGIKNFLELSIMVLANFIIEEKLTVSEEWFVNVYKTYPKDQVNKFLDSISKPIQSLRKWLKDNDKNRRLSYEFYEQTPFLKFPLIKTGREYICVHPNILSNCFEHFIYDRLRMWDAKKFMYEFGKVFERYVEKAIKYTGLSYQNENQIKQELGKNNGNVIDFIVVDDDANIFIDAKAVEMHSSGKVAHRPEIVNNTTKNSVIKAIKQAHDVLKKLQTTITNSSNLKNRDKNYLVVVTFKELYLGNGRQFYETIAKETIDEIYNEYSEDQKISLDNMYFITIDEFDVFVELIKSGKIGFVEGLEKAKADDQKPETRNFDFTLHMRSWKLGTNIPQYLYDESDQMFDRLEIAFKT